MSVPVVLTPSTVEAETAELVLSDGLRERDLLYSTGVSVYVVEFTPPVVPRENTYAATPDSEGQRRVRSKPQNAVGSMLVRVDRMQAYETAGDFRTDLEDLQDLIESAHKRKGSVRFLAPNADEAVTYDLESIQVTDAPMPGAELRRRRQEFVVEFETKPWGRLTEDTIFEDLPFATDQISSTVIEGVRGNVDALAELTLNDDSSEAADFVEFGLMQDGYNAAAQLRIEESEWELSGFAGTQPGGGSSHIVVSLTDEVANVCGFDGDVNGGRQKVVVQADTEDEGVWVRLSWRLQSGNRSFGRWQPVPAIGPATAEINLAVVDVDDASSWQFQVEAFAETTADMNINEAFVIPAQRNGRARAGNDAPVFEADGRVKFTSEGAFRGSEESKVLLDGDVLRIPPETANELPSLLVIRRRLNDVDAGLAAAGLASDLLATLVVTPRVALF
jgi:hypothetical protein